MSHSIRTTNWNHINKVIKTKPKSVTTQQKKVRIVKRILNRYDLWHNGVVVKSVRRANSTYLTHTVITEAYSLAKLFIAISTNNKHLIKDAINLRINLRDLRR